jgi:hypothetical protein
MFTENCATSTFKFKNELWNVHSVGNGGIYELTIIDETELEKNDEYSRRQLVL